MLLLNRLRLKKCPLVASFLPDTAQEKPQQGTIVATGPGKVSDAGTTIAMEVKKGDKILYGKYSGTEFAFEGTDFLIMRESDILAVL